MLEERMPNKCKYICQLVIVIINVFHVILTGQFIHIDYLNLMYNLTYLKTVADALQS